MTDRKGDPAKQPPECGVGRGGNSSSCPHLKEINPLNPDGETYECEVCGERFELYYEDMK